ncbi:nuclear transition protein 2 [Crocuta crocuta]
MDTKTQSLPIAHTQPHGNSRPQSHTCSPCNCSSHCHSCGQTCGRTCGQSRSGSCSRSRTSSHSPTGPQSQSPSPSPPPRHQKHSQHSCRCPPQPTAHSCSYPKNRKNLERKVNKRKVARRSPQAHKTKRRNSGRKYD